MSKPIPSILAGLTLSTTALLGVGCDDNASRSAKAAASLQEAAAVFRTAEQGFAPAEYEGGYPAFRLAKLDEAHAKLSNITSRGEASPAKADAHRLLAGIDTAIARVHANRADSAFAMIRGQSTGLFNHLAAVERINALLVARAGDGGSVSGALDEGQTLIRQSKAGLTTSIAELTAQREAATLEAQRHNAEAASQYETAAEFEQAAFSTADVDAKQGAYNQAYAAQVAGEAAKLEAERAQILAQSLAAKLAPLQTELELWDKMATQVTQLQDRVSKDAAEASQDVSVGRTARTTAIAAVDEQFQSLAKVFEEDVMKPLDAAVASANSAIENADKAATLSKSDRAAIQLEKTAAQVALVHVLARQSSYAKAFAQTLEAMIANPALKDAPVLEGYRTTQQALMQKSTALADQARAVITASAEANPLPADGSANPDDPAVALARTLQSYGSQLN